MPPTALAAGEGVLVSPAAFAAGRDNDNGAYALCAGVKASCNTLQTSGFLAPSQRSFRIMSLGENMFNFLGATGLC